MNRAVFGIVALVFAFTGMAQARDEVSGVCPPDGYSREQLGQLKADSFAMEDAAERNRLAIGLAGCISDPDPLIRDGVAFEAVSGWLRGQILTPETILALYDTLLTQLGANSDVNGFQQPFAALLLSEVARADRIEAVLTGEQREDLVGAAAVYLSGVRDYRGFSESGGWRHGVAHGSDLVLQLVLNPNVDTDQIERLMTALATQVAPAGNTFYVYGEPGRLARAVYYAHARGIVPDTFWDDWMKMISRPQPLASWSAAFSSQAGLAKRHNTLAFLLALHFNTTLDGDEKDASLGELVKAAILRVWS